MIRILALGVLLSAASTGLKSPTGEPLEARSISIADFRYAPLDLTVRVGDTVVWENKDSFLHTTSADSGAWQSGELQRGQRFRLIPKKPGRFTYHCAAHPVMRGILNVRQ